MCDLKSVLKVGPSKTQQLPKYTGHQVIRLLILSARDSFSTIYDQNDSLFYQDCR